MGLQEAEVFIPPDHPCTFEGGDMSRSSKTGSTISSSTRGVLFHTLSNGSISPDLGDMWHHGYLMSPQWEGGLELDSASYCDKADVEVGTAAAQGHATESGPKDFFRVIRDSSRLPHTSYFDEVHSPRNRIWELPEAIEGVPFVPYERHVPSLSAIEETLHGTIWSLSSPLLTTDDVVKCRTVARRWNVGCRMENWETYSSSS